MRGEELNGALNRAFPVEGPVASILVPEPLLKALVLSAREVTFLEWDRVEQASIINELDRTSEAVVDLVDVTNDDILDMQQRRAELRQAASVVRTWLDAGCITPPPGRDIRALVVALQ